MLDDGRPIPVLRLRFVHREKKMSLQTPQINLSLKVKARLPAQASREPLARQGLLKLDLPCLFRSW